MAVLQGGVYPAELVSDVDLTGATVTCRTIAPNGTVSPETPVTPSGKTATFPIVASLVGTYLIVWTISGPVTGTVQDQFTCEAPHPDLMSLSDIKSELQLRPDDTTKDAKLRRWLRAATDVAENVMGPIVPRARTDWFDAGGPFVVLTSPRASAITAVAELSGTTITTLTEQPFGGSLSTTGYQWDRTANIVYRTGNTRTFPAGTRAVQIDYTVGMGTIPDDVQLGAAELIRHWYRKNEVSSRTASQYAGGNGDDGVMVGNYMVPNAVMELWAPWRRPPQIA